MPNIRRSFPGNGSNATHAKDDETNVDASSSTLYPTPQQQHGKQFRVTGGKGFRPDDAEDDDDDDDDEEEDEEENNSESSGDDDGDENPATSVPFRSGGKQLRAPGGKYLRPPPQDDDDSEEDEESEDDDDVSKDDEIEQPPPSQPIRVMPRGGGKNFLRPPPQESDDDDSEEEDSDEEDDDEEAAAGEGNVADAPPPESTYRVAPRGGGKSLARMQPPPDQSEESSSEESDVDEADDDQPAVQRVVQRSGGKGLYNHHGGGKQLRRIADDEPAQVVKASIMPAGGKMLRPPDSYDEADVAKPTEMDVKDKLDEMEVEDSSDSGDEEEDDIIMDDVSRLEKSSKDTEGLSANEVTIVDKQEDSVKPSKPAEAPKATKPVVVKAPAGGKQLRRPDPVADEPSSTITPRPPVGGKQLKKPAVKRGKSKKTDDGDDDEADGDLDESDSDDQEVNEDEDNEDEYQESKTKQKKVQRPRRRATIKGRKKVVDEEDEVVEDVPTKKPTKSKPIERPTRVAAMKSKKIVEEEEEEIIGDDDISSNDDDDDVIELDINNTEALIKDEADRKHLDSLPELEREAILGERFEKLKAEQDMKKAIREAKRKEAEKAMKDESGKKGKTTAPKPASKTKTRGDEELAKSLVNRRESGRDRDKNNVKSKKAAALAALKKEKQIQQQQQRDESSDESGLDFGDDDGDSDEDYDEEEGLKPWQKKAKTSKSTVSRLDHDDESGEDMEIDNDEDDEAGLKKASSKTADEKGSILVIDADLEDFKKVSIPRRRLARWCNEPFFKEAIVGFFVRLFIGEDEKGTKVYRLCEIIDVNTSNKVHKFPVANTHDPPISTNKTLRLKFGLSEKDFPMYLVSDAAPDEIDIQKYITTQKNHRLEVISKRRANKLRRLQDELVNNYTYTKEDIERNVEQRRKQRKSAGKLASEQTRVAIAVQAARDSVKDMERQVAEAKRDLIESTAADEAKMTQKISECERELANAKKLLEVRLEEERTMVEAVQDRKRKLVQRSKDLNWAKVNEKAVIANQRADREANKQNKDSSLPGIIEKKEFNPYARRRVKPKILWEVGQKEEEEKAEEKKDIADNLRRDDAATSNDTPTPNLVQESQGKASALRDRHQFAIDEEILANSTTIDSILGGTRKKSSKQDRVRKGISLAEYLERKEKGEF